jgi:hypothetical protein
MVTLVVNFLNLLGKELIEYLHSKTQLSNRWQHLGYFA